MVRAVFGYIILGVFGAWEVLRVSKARAPVFEMGYHALI